MKWIFGLGLIVSLIALGKGEKTLKQQLEEKKQANSKGVDTQTAKIMSDSMGEIIKSGAGKQALKIGQKAPVHTLQSLSGGLVALETLYKKQPLVVKFYRGAWCPYCRIELQAYDKMMPQFHTNGIRFLAVSPDNFQEIRKMKKELKIGFLIMKDKDNALASKFGLKFTLPKQLEKLYKQFGIDVKKSTGQTESNLPIPGTYIIDSAGNVRYAFVEVDYTKRAEPSEVLKQAIQIAKTPLKKKGKKK